MPKKPRIYTNDDPEQDPEIWSPEELMRCDGSEECSLGAICPCYEAGATYGEENSLLEQAEEQEQELLDGVYYAIDKILTKAIQPLEDQHLLKGNQGVVGELNRLHELKKKILQVLQ